MITDEERPPLSSAPWLADREYQRLACELRRSPGAKRRGELLAAMRVIACRLGSIDEPRAT